MSVYMPKINYILLIYRNLFLTPIHASKLLLLNSLMEFLGTNTDIHLIVNCYAWYTVSERRGTSPLPPFEGGEGEAKRWEKSEHKVRPYAAFRSVA